MTLYDIDEKILALLEDGDIFDAETGEVLSDELFAALEELQATRELKIENTLLYIKVLEADAAAMKFEETVLRARRKSKENRSESLRNYISQVLDGTRFETPRVVVAWRRSEAVDITDEAALPEDYVKIVIERKPDKAAIKATLKQGIQVRGACPVEHNNMQIK